MIAKVVPADRRPTATSRVGDLLFVLPHSVIDRRNRPGIALAAEGAIVTLEVRVDRHQPPPRGNTIVPYRVFAHDDTGEIALTFFHAHAAYLEKAMPVGEQSSSRGRMEWFNGRPTMVHPDHIALAGDADEPAADRAGLSADRRPVGQGAAPRDRPGAGAPARRCRNGRTTAVMRRQTFPAFAEALTRLHNPADPIDVAVDGAAWRRLAYDELLAGQLSLALVRAHVRRLSGPAADRRRPRSRRRSAPRCPIR